MSPSSSLGLPFLLCQVETEINLNIINGNTKEVIMCQALC